MRAARSKLPAACTRAITEGAGVVSLGRGVIASNADTLVGALKLGRGATNLSDMCVCLPFRQNSNKLSYSNPDRRGAPYDGARSLNFFHYSPRKVLPDILHPSPFHPNASRVKGQEINLCQAIGYGSITLSISPLLVRSTLLHTPTMFRCMIDRISLSPFLCLG